jgi:hypothetical protein
MSKIYTDLIDSDWHNALITNINNIVNNTYKSKYKKYYDFILKFIKVNKLLISNINLLIEEDIQYNEPLEIYVINPKEVATQLLNKICSKLSKEFLIKVEIEDKHYSIDHISKTYLKISYINQYKNTTLLDYIHPTIINDYILLPPILELINIYKKIYNPEYVNEWENLINQSIIIKKITDENIKKTIKNIKGGDECIKCPKEDLQLKKVKEELINCINNYKDYLYVHLPDKIITVLSKNEIQTDFERFNNYLNKKGDYTLTFKEKNLFIGKDLRINKYSIYVSISKSFINKQIPILDIYNNLSYELVPFKCNNNLNIIHPWVEIRFYYIEIWNILVAYNIKLINLEKLEQYISNIINKINLLNLDWKELPIKYNGIYINEYQAFKQVILSKGRLERIYC